MRRITWLLVAIFLGLGAGTGWAQPSLIDGDRRDYSVSVGGLEERITVYRDARFQAQWYYVPNKPRLVVQEIDNVMQPMFGIVGFAFNDSGTTGGLLNFTVNMALPANAFADLKLQIQKTTGLKDVYLSAVPITKAKAFAFYRPTANDKKGTEAYAKFLTSSSPGELGDVPNEITQNLAASLLLTKDGYDIARDGAENDNILIAYQFDYECLTRPEGFKVTINWDRVYDAFATQSEIRSGWSVLGIIGDESTSTTRNMWELLKKYKTVEVAEIVGKTYKEEDVQRYLPGILKEISDAVVEDMSPGQAPEAKPGGNGTGLLGQILVGDSFFRFSGSNQYASATKSTRRRGTYTFDFSRRKVIDMPTVASDFVGIKRYPAQRDRLIRFIKATNWEEAFFKTPAVGKLNGWKPTSADLSINLHFAGHQILKRTLEWSGTSNKWTTVGQDVEESFLRFYLKGMGISADQFKTGQFEVETTVEGESPGNDGDVITVRRTIPIQNTREVISRPSRLIEIGTISVTGLSWSRLDPASKLSQVIWEVDRVGQKKAMGTVQPILNEQNQWVAPQDIKFALEAPDPAHPGVVPAARVTISFVVGNRRVFWRQNGLNIRDLSNIVVLTPDDTN